jgi:hypothetical protein
MVAQPAGLFFAAREIGDEVLDSVEQGQSPERQCLSPREYLGTRGSGAIAIVCGGTN